MTASATGHARRTALHALTAGDTVQVCVVRDGAFHPVALAAVVKVLARSVRVAWAEGGEVTTDFTLDTGKVVGERRWTGYPIVRPVG